ncbi:MAG: hypothetical protein HY649_12845 [Acidobacteria bacterium]|nr:hypothetical protein [Acidobacteriota bacterium]
MSKYRRNLQPALREELCVLEYEESSLAGDPVVESGGENTSNQPEVLQRRRVPGIALKTLAQNRMESVCCSYSRRDGVNYE